MKQVAELRRLGDLYEDRGDYESAELLFRKALSVQEQELGEEHPLLAPDLYNLGLLCYALEKFNDAETFLMRAWAIERTSFGPMHPETLATLEALSELYYDANRNVHVEYPGIIPAHGKSLHHSAVHMYH
ncbi:MAG: tetratricopeptide repeat protein [Terriglobales bacterium]